MSALSKTLTLPLLLPPSWFLAMRNFVLIPQHTSPDYAVQEVDALYDVVTDVRKRWNTNVNTPQTHSHTQSIILVERKGEVQRIIHECGII